jgi:predicted O-methyltransferase YrrM
MLFGSFLRKKIGAPENPLDIRSRTELLNHLVARHHYRRYLEIGVRNPRDNFWHIDALVKESVDPQARATHRMTSDAFFLQHAAQVDRQTFDLIFVDGLHLADQVERDVENSLRALSEGSAIVLHDCNPVSENAQIEE